MSDPADLPLPPDEHATDPFDPGGPETDDSMLDARDRTGGALGNAPAAPTVPTLPVSSGPPADDDDLLQPDP